MLYSTIFTILSLFSAPLAIVAAPAPAPEAVAGAQPEAHHHPFGFDHDSSSATGRPQFSGPFGPGATGGPEFTGPFGPGATGGPDFSGSFGPRPTNYQGPFETGGANDFNTAVGNSRGRNTFVQSTRAGGNGPQVTEAAATTVASAAETTS